MYKPRTRISALARVILTEMRQTRRPMGMDAIVMLAKRNGCTPADARLAAHKLVEGRHIEFTSNPTAVELQLVEGEA